MEKNWLCWDVPRACFIQ